jgi:hypothetical protein
MMPPVKIHRFKTGLYEALLKTMGGVLFQKVIHEFRKDSTDIDDIDTEGERIEQSRKARHGKSIICISQY